MSDLNALRERANEVRAQRAALKKRVGSGRISLATVLFDPPEYARSMKATALLKAVKGIGPVKVARMEARLDLNGTPLQELSLTQRRRLLVYLAERHPNVSIERKRTGERFALRSS